ncbi:SRPBCC family protein [Oleidesulfovibrio sp.]|uniref:SRPBCC family protein n=1 Tax=Oleidesulfovibrio sp. TaxID=2909707 RepID=UPI003A8548A9
MLIIQHSVKTKASPKAVWALWQDINNWSKWDHGIEQSELFGDFEVGAKGWLKPVGGPKVNFEILELEPLKTFHDRSYLPLTKLDFIHTLSQEGDFTIVTQRVEMTGLLAFVFSKIIGTGIKKDMPLAMKKLVGLAEAHS